MTQQEIIDRGNKLSKKYSINELKDALKDAIAWNDNLERLALQWALKQKTKTDDGYKFTKKQNENIGKKLKV